MGSNGILLSIKSLSTHFLTEEGVARAVQDVSISVKKGKTFALVGESGDGSTELWQQFCHALLASNELLYVD